MKIRGGTALHERFSTCPEILKDFSRLVFQDSLCRLALNSGSACHCLPSARFKGVHHHAQQFYFLIYFALYFCAGIVRIYVHILNIIPYKSLYLGKGPDLMGTPQSKKVQ